MYPLFIHPVDSAIYSTVWLPGKLKGVPVDTSIFIPIIFKMFDKENAPPLNIIAERYQSRGHWEYLPVFIDTTCVSIPDERPENFSFIFKWWYLDRDSLCLNTSENYLKSRYRDVDTSITFSLSEKDLDSIYRVMKQIHFLCYPRDFSPGFTGWMDPSFSYYCKMKVNDFENEISLKTGLLSDDPSYKRLKDFYSMIDKVIRQSADYQKIRKPERFYIYE
jgi:hypothetical protein